MKFAKVVVAAALAAMFAACETPSESVPDAEDTPCGVGDHPCCPADDPQGRPPCIEGYRCENERGKGYFECNPDVPDDGDHPLPPPPEAN